MRVLILVTVLLVISVVFSQVVARDLAYDWRGYFKPAALHWSAPYLRKGICNAPWLYLLLNPIARITWPVDFAILTFLTLTILAVYVRSPLALLALLTTPPAITLLAEGQLDALAMLGLLAPAWLGLPLALAKPQGILLAALRRTTITALVVTCLVLVISFAVWGWWPADLQLEHNTPWTFWPTSILLAILAGLVGWWKRSDTLLCLATILAVPYFSPSSLTPLVAAALRETRSKLWWPVIIGICWWWYFTFRAR